MNLTPIITNLFKPYCTVPIQMICTILYIFKKLENFGDGLLISGVSKKVCIVQNVDVGFRHLTGMVEVAVAGGVIDRFHDLTSISYLYEGEGSLVLNGCILSSIVINRHLR